MAYPATPPPLSEALSQLNSPAARSLDDLGLFAAAVTGRAW